MFAFTFRVVDGGKFQSYVGIVRVTMNHSFKVRQAAHVQGWIKVLEDRHIDVRAVKVQVKVVHVSDCAFDAECTSVRKVRA